MARPPLGACPAAVLFAVLLAGCAGLGEPYVRPPVAVPAVWSGTGTASEGLPPASDWWQAFGSRELDALIGQAHANSHELKAAAARVEQARAFAEVVGADRYPLLSADAAAARSRVSGSAASDSYALGLGAAWELDLWGRNRQALVAAEAALQASREAEAGLRLNLAAEVATNYFQLLALNDNLQATQDSLANIRRVLALIELQKQAGRVSALDLEQQRGALASAEAAIPPLLRQRLATLYALALLTGRIPGTLAEPEQRLTALELPPVALLAPRDLLERRPDLREAEAALRAAHADLGAARAALLPRLQLSARAVTTAATAGALFDPGTGFTTLGLDALATIFDGGRLAGRVGVSLARQHELIESYRQAVLSAWREVEDARAGVELLAAQEDRQRAARRHAGEALRLAELRYRAGATDFLSVLDAQRTLINADAALSNTRFQRFAALVALYRAQGGPPAVVGGASAVAGAPAGPAAATP